MVSFQVFFFFYYIQFKIHIKNKFTTIKIREMKQILTFDKLETSNIVKSAEAIIHNNS